MNTKKSMRKFLRNQRMQHSPAKQQQKSRQIANHILESNIFKESKKVAYYHAVRGEADPSILSMSGDKYKQFYLPILSTKKQALEFVAITPETQYQNNQFNIPEPIYQQSELINANELDLLILPLLGFDDKGNRLGMGGGFYDRCLEYKQHDPTSKPTLIGFAYDFQKLDKLEAEPWDIKLDWISTESGLQNLSTNKN